MVPLQGDQGTTSPAEPDKRLNIENFGKIEIGMTRAGRARNVDVVLYCHARLSTMFSYVAPGTTMFHLTDQL